MAKMLRTQIFGPTVYIPQANARRVVYGRGTVLGRVVESGLPYEIVNVGKSDRDYFDLVERLWGEGRTFLIVEHDIVVTPVELASMARCSHGWCANPYPYLGSTYAGLGCVKFSGDFIKINPGALTSIAALGARDPVHPPRHWCALDGRLRATLEIAGHDPHLHHAKIDHLNHDGKPSHNCYTNDERKDQA